MAPPSSDQVRNATESGKAIIPTATSPWYQLPILLAYALEQPEATYPPYNIAKVGEDQYRIVMAVDGLGKDNVELVQE
jgi:hypothetical protein